MDDRDGSFNNVPWLEAVMRGRTLFGALFEGNPFLYGKTRFLRPAKKVDIEDLGSPDQSFFGFDVDFFEDALPTVDRDHGLEGIVYSLDDDLQPLKAGQNDLELVLVEFLLANNPIGILSLNRIQLFMPAVFQNPINIDRPCLRRSMILLKAEIILNKILVLTPLNEKKMIDFLRRN